MQDIQISVETAFGITAPNATAPGYVQDSTAPWSDYVPAADPDYLFTEDSLRDVLAWWKLTKMGMLTSEGFLTFGPKGAGKTSLILQIAARLGIPVIEVTGHGRLEVDDLLGHNTVVDGDILFLDGPLTTAARLGAWVLVNEIDAIDPSQQVGLNSFVEHRPFLIPQTGETVVPHSNFRVLATANTNLSGDMSGTFAGTQRQNSAFADRFMFSEASYPAAVAEEGILMKFAPGLGKDFCAVLVSVANHVRTLHNDGAVDITLSTRSLIRWAKLTWAFQKVSGINQPVVYAMHRAFGFQTDPDSRMILEEALQRVLTKKVA